MLTIRTIKLVCSHPGLNWKQSKDSGQYYIDEMNPNYSRVKKTAKRIASFQKSLSTFGVETLCFISLSRTQSKIQNEIGIDGSKVIVSGGKSLDHIADETQDVFLKSVINYGGKAEVINDLNIISSEYKPQTLSDLQISIAKKSENISAMDFDEGLYDVITTHLPKHVSANLENKKVQHAGIIWVDLMSPAAGWHREQLQKSLSVNNPCVPSLVISKNSGKWWSRSDSESEFSTKLSILAKELKLKVSPSSLPTNSKIIKNAGYKSLISFFDNHQIPKDFLDKDNKRDALDFIIEMV